MDKNNATLRFCKYYEKTGVPEKYRHSYRVVDEHSQQELAHCDIIGQPLTTTFTISDNSGQSWLIKPNRKIFPTRWIITDSNENTIMQFDQKALAKFVNPIYKVMLSFLDSEDQEHARLVDPRDGVIDRIMSAYTSSWVVLKKDMPVAEMVLLPRKSKPKKGLLGKLRSLIKLSDDGLISAGSEHFMAPHIALGMYIIFRELRSTMAAT
ncbi:hypothetical protein L3Q72_21885 [Vibrio sp. JC009]|uniref:hypothetical protein n=1 Tax=Vibrio sp. JC009 TaxID=2912314 RepID=UPI0023AF8518|nr:hypothetical protein [Vibrio sp. JC009]WED23886.1 hypothetical protein L3Q72_21885 [Vibrio sp. JC009]